MEQSLEQAEAAQGDSRPLRPLGSISPGEQGLGLNKVNEPSEEWGSKSKAKDWGAQYQTLETAHVCEAS